MKKLLFNLLCLMGATKFAAWWHRKYVIILCYHGVTERPTRSPDDPKGLHVNKSRFEKHLDYLQENYNLVSLENYLEARRSRRPLPNYSAVLTFDDGFRNFLTVAAPILTRRRIPATVFLITDNAATANGDRECAQWVPDDDQRHLSWAEALELKETFSFGFGSHTCSHSRLLGLSDVEIRRELLHSLGDCVAKLGIEYPVLSYPKGEYSNRLASFARKVGYAAAVTTDRGFNEMNHDAFTLGRALIGDYDDEASLAVRASGLRWWLVKLLVLLGRRSNPQPHSEDNSDLIADSSGADPSLNLLQE